ncbi:MAG: hypothetical protein ACKOE6_09405, partial [Flammeovirgaceae bacterium]
MYVVVEGGFAIKAELTAVPVYAPPPGNDKPVVGDHVYVEAPLGVNVVVFIPEQNVGFELVTLTTGVAFDMVTVVVPLTEQPETGSVPVTVWVVVAAGAAVTLAPIP